MTGEKPFKGYLDRLRENVEVLDEAIESVRKAPKGEKPTDKRARLKLARDLVELRNTTLGNIEGHLNGHGETGVVQEPPDLWDEDPQVEFERIFQKFLSPWSQKDLELRCEYCGARTEDVSRHHWDAIEGEHYRRLVDDDEGYACPDCIKRREMERQARARHAQEQASQGES